MSGSRNSLMGSFKRGKSASVRRLQQTFLICPAGSDKKSNVNRGL